MATCGSQSGLEAELLSTKARLAAVEAELADTKQQLAVALASSSAAAAAPPPPAAAAPAAPAGSAAPLDRPGALLVELASDLSFLSPRGKFRLSLNEGAAVLHGKSAEIGQFLHPAETPRLAREVGRMVERARAAALRDEDPAVAEPAEGSR